MKALQVYAFLFRVKEKEMFICALLKMEIHKISIILDQE